MFIREQKPENLKPEEMVRWLEDKFEKEKLLSVALIDDYFIFMNFEEFSTAVMKIVTRMMIS